MSLDPRIEDLFKTVKILHKHLLFVTDEWMPTIENGLKELDKRMKAIEYMLHSHLGIE